jgi:hypothetical protein
MRREMVYKKMHCVRHTFASNAEVILLPLLPSPSPSVLSSPLSLSVLPPFLPHTLSSYCYNFIREEQWAKVSTINPVQFQLQTLETKLQDIETKIDNTNEKLGNITLFFSLFPSYLFLVFPSIFFSLFPSIFLLLTNQNRQTFESIIPFSTPTTSLPSTPISQFRLPCHLIPTC